MKLYNLYSKTNWVNNILKRLEIQKILPKITKRHGMTLLKWAIIGYLVRVAVMPLFYTGDQMSIAWGSLILMKDHQLVASSDPPTIFYVFSVFYTLVRPILPGNVLDFLVSKPGYTPTWFSGSFYFNMSGVRTFLLVSKIPYLVFDFATAILLLKLIDDDERKALSAFKLWMMNPFAVSICYAIGQFDIIPVFFLILGLYFFKAHKVRWAMLAIGIAGAFKIFSMLFVLPLALIYFKEHRSLAVKAKGITELLGISSLPIILTLSSLILIPTYYESANAANPDLYDFNGFFGRTLYSRGNPTQPLFGGLFLYALDYSVSLKTLPTFWDVIYFFPLIYGLFLLGIIYWRDWSFERVWKVILIFFLAYYSVTLFHIQWFLWAQPLLTLLIVGAPDKFLKLYVISIPLYFIYTSYWNADLVSAMNSIGLPGVQVVNLCRSILSGVCIFTIFLILKRDFVRMSRM